MCGMEKTTVYVPADLKRALARTAAARGQSEAALKTLGPYVPATK